MIHYSLRCETGHEFDGWFRDSSAFDKQAARGLIECPACGGTKVARGLMAPAVGRGRAEPAPPPAPAPEKPAEVSAAGPMPAQMVAMLQRLRQEIESRCDDVGDDFAAEARAMHAGESEKRGIYGNTTPDEAEALRDEGIEVSRIPWVPRAD